MGLLCHLPTLSLPTHSRWQGLELGREGNTGLEDRGWGKPLGCPVVCETEKKAGRDVKGSLGSEIQGFG